MKEQVREIVQRHTEADVARCGDAGDLWRAGMRSKEAVRVMLAIEDEFDIEFPPAGLSTETFSSIDSIHGAVRELASERAGA